MTFAEEVKSMRLSLVLSQAKLAEELGVSRQTVNYWENGAIRPRSYTRKGVRALLLKLSAKIKRKQIRELSAKLKEPRDIAAIGVKQDESLEIVPDAGLSTGGDTPRNLPEVREQDLVVHEKSNQKNDHQRSDSYEFEFGRS